MHVLNIDSQNIHEISHDGNVLRVKEQDGSITAYLFVDSRVIDNFLNAQDKDEYFEVCIKNNLLYHKKLIKKGRR